MTTLINYKQTSDFTVQLEANPGDAGGVVTKHDVRASALPAGASTAGNQATEIASLTTISGFLNTLQGAITAARMAVNLDSTNTAYLANLTNITTYLNTLQGAITASRMAVNLDSTNTAYLANLTNITTYLNTLQGAISSSRMNINLDSTALGYLAPATAIYTGNKNVTTAGTSVALASSQVLTKGIRIRGKDANTGLIYINGASLVGSNGNGGDRLAPGEPYWTDQSNLTNISIDAAVSGEGVTFSAW